MLRTSFATAFCVLAVSGSLVAQTTPWSTPPRTQQVDPERMKNPEVVATPAPLDPAVVGTWELWVPGGVWYSSDGSRVYRNYTPGAAMNRITISADGRYRWASHSGRLTQVRPWFAQAGQCYYAVALDDANRYMARYDAQQGKLLLFFWGVGGHAATGTRTGGTKAGSPASCPGAPAQAVSQAPKPSEASPANAAPRPTEAPRANEPARPATAPASPTNPLGVEWRTASSPAQSPPLTAASSASSDPCAPNALGVVWAQCQQTQAAPATPARPTPAPTASLSGSWRYAGVTFRGVDGRIEDYSSRIGGTLTLRADGTFEQDLSVSGQAVRRSGTYRVLEDRIEIASPSGQRATLWFRQQQNRLELQERNDGTVVTYALINAGPAR